MLEDSEDPVVKTVQPTIKIGRKWKVVEAVDEIKECPKIKDVIGQTQTDRKGLGSSTAKWWSKAEGKEKRDMVINEIRLDEDSRRHKGLIGIMPCRNRSHGMRSGTWRHFGSAFSSVNDLLPSNANLVRWEKKEDLTCLLCQGMPCALAKSPSHRGDTHAGIIKPFKNLPQSYARLKERLPSLKSTR